MFNLLKAKYLSKKYVKEMAKLETTGYAIEEHEQADKLLKSFLMELGYTELVQAYEKVEKNFLYA